MLQKRIILFFISTATVVLLYNVPFYKEWMYRRVLVPDENGDIFYQAQHLGIEERKQFRYGGSYAFFQSLAVQFSSNNITNVTIFLPPNDYIALMKIPDLLIPEPAVFYYFTGLNAVNKNSPNVRTANWALAVQDTGHIFMNRIKGPQDIDVLLRLYKNYQN
jgi:hypothetical protein